MPELTVLNKMRVYTSTKTQLKIVGLIICPKQSKSDQGKTFLPKTKGRTKMRLNKNTDRKDTSYTARLNMVREQNRTR